MELTEKSIEQLTILIKNKGNCAYLNAPCRLCIMRKWCKTYWPQIKGKSVFTQRVDKAKDILIYRDV